MAAAGWLAGDLAGWFGGLSLAPERRMGTEWERHVSRDRFSDRQASSSGYVDVPVWGAPLSVWKWLDAGRGDREFAGCRLAGGEPVPPGLAG